MASKRRILRSSGDVALVEEQIYILIPFLTIETAYFVTSERLQEGVYFDSLAAATQVFKAEIIRSVDKRGNSRVTYLLARPRGVQT